MKCVLVRACMGHVREEHRHNEEVHDKTGGLSETTEEKVTWYEGQRTKEWRNIITIV